MDTDQLPVSADGGLLDIHVTAFVTAMDALLSMGRSSAPSQVLTLMKHVVDATAAIVEDVRTYERRRDRSDNEVEIVHALRERAEATLSNLVIAVKTHATSMGMSPVSLLDAAASHLSACITEIGKTIFICKATKSEQDQFVTTSVTNSVNGYLSTPRSPESVAQHQKVGSLSGSRRSDDTSSTGMSKHTSTAISSPERNGKQRASSSSTEISPPPLYDQQANASDESTPPEGPEEAWAELKVFNPSQLIPSD